MKKGEIDHKIAFCEGQMNKYHNPENMNESELYGFYHGYKQALIDIKPKLIFEAEEKA